MNFVRKKWLQSRWIEMPALPSGMLLRSSAQAKKGLVMGMRLAVLEEQAAAVVAENQLVSVYLPGAYTLEEDKMPHLTPDAKYAWLFPAEVFFLNMAPFRAQAWEPAAPVLARDPDFGLVQLEVDGTYEAQIDNATVFTQTMIIERGLREWAPLHNWLCDRLSELTIGLAARHQIQLQRLDKLRERGAQALLRDLNQELQGTGLTVTRIDLNHLRLHPTMQRLLQERQELQQESSAYNRALLRSILG